MTAEQILEMLMTQTFADFYKGDLDSFITGEEDAMTKEEIIKEIRKMKDDVCPGRERMRQMSSLSRMISLSSQHKGTAV
jgi:hypothetical protein